MNRIYTVALLLLLSLYVASSPLAHAGDLGTGITEAESPAYLAEVAGSELPEFLTSECDIDKNGTTNVSDVQLMINQAGGVSAPVDDLNGDGKVTVADVQIVINAALGLGCLTSSSTITFSPIPNRILGISPFVISATASSGFGVTFASTTPKICKTVANLVTLLSVGSCSIVASQSVGTEPTVTRSFAVNPANPSATFTPAAGSPIPVGTNPSAVAVGDFNNDGALDLAVANTTSNNLTILLGSGGGNFTTAPASPIAIPGGPVAIAVADFNGDGIQDLAVANLNGNNVAVLLGNGAGGFTAAPGSPIATGTNPVYISVGDFNNDGTDDLVVANLNSANITVLLGTGLGEFSPAPGSPFTVGVNPEAVAVGDFNNDGIQDLVTANYNGTFTVLLGQTSGGFVQATGSPFASAGNPTSVVVGDFNGDGSEDVAMGNDTTNTVAVFLGNGRGGFAAATGSPFAVGVGRGSIAVADFNGDGIQDLAVVSGLETTSKGTGPSNVVSVLIGNGSGGFSPAAGSPYTAGNEPVWIVAADLNGDGIEDLAVSNLNSSNVSVFLGNGATGLALLRLQRR